MVTSIVTPPQESQGVEPAAAPPGVSPVAGIVTVDEKGVIIDVDTDAADLFGAMPAQLVGQRLGLDGAKDIADYLRLRDDGEGADWRSLDLIRNRVGQVVPVQVTVTPLRQPQGRAYQFSYREIIDHEAAGDVMHCRTGGIVESCDVLSIASESLDGGLITWNRGAERMWGYSAAEVAGRRLSMLVPPDRQAQMEALWARARAGEPTESCETVWLTKDGAPLDVEVTICPVRTPTGNIAAVATYALDITDRRQREERERRFLAEAAHQLRNPIASMRTCVDTLLRTDSEESRERFLGYLDRETQRASRLVAQLLRTARLDAGEKLSPQPCDLVALCEAEALRLDVHAPHLDVFVRLDGEFEGDPWLDAEVVAEILSNLLDNASRYAMSRIDLIICPRGAEEIVIVVRDDGPGMTPDQAEQAFERFISFTRSGGSGLGLSIARDLARLHGGDLTYSNGQFLIRLQSRPNIARY